MRWSYQRDRWHALHRLWRMQEGYNLRKAPDEDVIRALMKWVNMRQRPMPWHYALRWYRSVVLPRKDWRLPWR